MYPGIELRLLRYVIVIAEELHFTRASARLYLSQPPLTRQVRELEEYLGVKLFERDKRHVTLTAAGEAFLREAREALLHAERAVEVARAAKNGESGPFLVGYSPLIDLRIVSMAKKLFARGHPQTAIQFVSAFTTEQIDALLRGAVHAGLVIPPVNEPNLIYQPLVRDSLLLALPEGHALASKDELEITDLRKLPLITMRRMIEPRFGRYLERAFRLADVAPHFVQEATTQAEALELVAEGGMAALLMPSAERSHHKGVIFRKFADGFLTAETGFAYHRSTQSATLASLKDFLQEKFSPLTSESAESPDQQLDKQIPLF